MKMTSTELLNLVRQLADPRGRCSRQTFLYVAVAFLALQVSVGALLQLAGLDLGSKAMFVLNAPILWIGTTVCVKRVHDIGYRGWVMLAAFGIWLVGSFVLSFGVGLVFGPQAIADGGIAYALLFSAIMVPALGGLLWVHATAGQTAANVFGPVPAEFGLSMPEASHGFGMASDAMVA